MRKSSIQRIPGSPLLLAHLSFLVTAWFFLTPRIFLVRFFRSLICFRDLFTGASISPFCLHTEAEPAQHST